ncbi:MAG: ECF transporter S component [Ruminococcaceae bacterium]|nr:ECF transporter S component [Oscillospiraceae bacterium]
MRNAGRTSLLKLAFSGMCLALCLLLPFLTGNSRELGNVLCLMHIPVLLVGILCGWQYGMAVGAVAPLMRSALFSMPPFPTVALPMAAELAVYGLMTGVLCRLLPKKTVWLYPNLVLSLTAGRIVSLLVKYAMYEMGKTQFSLTSAAKLTFVTTIPGVVLQLLLVPTLVLALRTGKWMRDE